MSMTFEEALEYIYNVVKCREQNKAKCKRCESCSYNFEFGRMNEAEKVIAKHYEEERNNGLNYVMRKLEELPPEQSVYKPVTAEDFAKTMSETSAYSYMAWYSEALSLMKRTGFVICKKKEIN